MLDLMMISEAVKVIAASEEKGRTFTDKEKYFITECAFKTGDMELIKGLVDNMQNGKEDNEVIMGQYAALYDKSAVWIDRLENLLVALEMYRKEEEKVLIRISVALKACGVDVTLDEIRDKETNEIKKMAKKAPSI